MGPSDVAQLILMMRANTQMMQAMRGERQQMEVNMKEEIKNNTKKMESNIKEEMKDEMKKMRGEMRQVGQCLQVDKMAPPRATTSELRGSAPAGEDRAIRETCWARRVEETVTVTQGGKLIGVTETCTRHIETRETMSEVTELTETREVTREVVERLHGTDGVVGRADAHTHADSEGQWG